MGRCGEKCLQLLHCDSPAEITEYLWRLELQGGKKSCTDRKSVRDFQENPVAQSVSPFLWSSLSLTLQTSGPVTLLTGFACSLTPVQSLILIGADNNFPRQ